jgi:hypothetical protein
MAVDLQRDAARLAWSKFDASERREGTRRTHVELHDFLSPPLSDIANGDRRREAIDSQIGIRKPRVR